MLQVAGSISWCPGSRDDQHMSRLRDKSDLSAQDGEVNSGSSPG